MLMAGKKPFSRYFLNNNDNNLPPVSGALEAPHTLFLKFTAIFILLTGALSRGLKGELAGYLNPDLYGPKALICTPTAQASALARLTCPPSPEAMEPLDPVDVSLHRCPGPPSELATPFQSPEQL